MLRSEESKFFPPADAAAADGLMRFGGSLAPEWLLDAYSHGIFPWPMVDEYELLAWWSPDPRAILEIDDLHVSRRLARTCRSGKFQVTCDRDFAGVLRGCAEAPDRRGGTWLSSSMMAAYRAMHELGHAHSVEVWRGERLVGGTYGVSIGGFFAAESKFRYETDASKVALVRLVRHLERRGYQLLDIQQLTEHTARFGGKEIPRRTYLRRLRAAITLPVTFGSELEGGPE